MADTLMRANTYKPTREESRLLVEEIVAAFGLQAREADIECVLLLPGNGSAEDLLKNTLDYVWDHLCGEPDEWSVESIWDQMRGLCDQVIAFELPITRDSLDRLYAKLEAADSDDRNPGTEGQRMSREGEGPIAYLGVVFLDPGECVEFVTLDLDKCKAKLEEFAQVEARESENAPIRTRWMVADEGAYRCSPVWVLQVANVDDPQDVWEDWALVDEIEVSE